MYQSPYLFSVIAIYRIGILVLHPLGYFPPPHPTYLYAITPPSLNQYNYSLIDWAVSLASPHSIPMQWRVYLRYFPWIIYVCSHLLAANISIHRFSIQTSHSLICFLYTLRQSNVACENLHLHGFSHGLQELFTNGGFPLPRTWHDYRRVSLFVIDSSLPYQSGCFSMHPTDIQALHRYQRSRCKLSQCLVSVNEQFLTTNDQLLAELILIISTYYPWLANFPANCYLSILKPCEPSSKLYLAILAFH